MEFRQVYEDVLASGARVAALATDPVDRSARFRARYQLPFRLLCDVDRRVCSRWSLLDTADRPEGIAYPAVWVLDSELRVQFRSLDRTRTRVSARPLLEFLRGTATAVEPQRLRPELVSGLKRLLRID